MITSNLVSARGVAESTAPQRRSRRVTITLRVLTAIAAVSTMACSVSTPRNGATLRAGDATGTEGEIAGQAATADGVATGSEAGANDSAGGTVGAAGAADSATAGGTGAGGTGATPVGGRSGPVSGVTADTVKIAVIAPFGGAYGAAIQLTYEGMLTWRDDVNARGGIYGRKVELVPIDNQNSAEGGIAACKKALSSGAFLAFAAASTFGTETNCLDKAGQLSMYFSAFERVTKDFSSSWGVLSPAEAIGRANARFVRSQLGGGTKKIGVIYVGGTASEVAANEFMAEAKKLGMNVVDKEVIEENQATYTSQVLRLQQSGAEVVGLFAILESVGVLRDARAIGYTPQWTGWGFTLDIVSRAARDLAKGMKGLKNANTADSDAAARMRAKMTKYGRSTANADGETLMFYGYGVVIERVLREAGPNLTRASYVAALARIRGYDPEGAIAPVGWPNGQSQGTDMMFPVECCDSNWNWKSLGPPASNF
jgi:ABC-type branched-subunit amino acid transport system substrate-binding protein